VLFIGAKDALGTWAEGGSRENGGLLRLGCWMSLKGPRVKGLVPAQPYWNVVEPLGGGT
jgi:hypothetical protein